MLKSFLPLILAVAVLFNSAQAETQEERIIVARELIDVIGGADMYRQMFEVTVNEMWPAIEAKSPGVSKKDLQIYKEEFAIALQGEIEGMIDATADIYARNLTMEEMRASIDFYRSAAGQALLAKLPVIMGEALQLGARLGAKVGENAVTRARSRMKERGVDL